MVFLPKGSKVKCVLDGVLFLRKRRPQTDAAVPLNSSSYWRCIMGRRSVVILLLPWPFYCFQECAPSLCDHFRSRVLYCFLPVIAAAMHPPLDDRRDLLEQKALFLLREVSTHPMLLMMTMIASLVGYCSNCISGEDECMLIQADCCFTSHERTQRQRSSTGG